MKRPKLFTLRLSDAEWKRACESAKKSGLSTSAWIRLLIMTADKDKKGVRT